MCVAVLLMRVVFVLPDLAVYDIRFVNAVFRWCPVVCCVVVECRAVLCCDVLRPAALCCDAQRYGMLN